MGLNILQRGAVIEERPPNQVGAELPKSPLFRDLFDGVAKIEAIFAGRDRRGRTTLYVLDKEKRLHRAILQKETADPKIWQAAETLLGKEEKRGQEVERPAQASAAPAAAIVGAAAPTAIEACPALPHPLEERIRVLEERLRREEEELTQARQSTDALKAQVKEWESKAERVLYQHQDKLAYQRQDSAQLKQRLEKRTQVIRLLNEQRKDQANRITALEGGISELQAAARHLMEAPRAALPPPADDRAPPAAAAVVVDERVGELARIVPQLREELANLRRELQEYRDEQEETINERTREAEERLSRAIAPLERQLLAAAGILERSQVQTGGRIALLARVVLALQRRLNALPREAPAEGALAVARPSAAATLTRTAISAALGLALVRYYCFRRRRPFTLTEADL